MVKCTGRGLVVKRPAVLSKVQMLTLVLGVGVFSILPIIACLRGRFGYFLFFFGSGEGKRGKRPSRWQGTFFLFCCKYREGGGGGYTRRGGGG